MSRYDYTNYPATFPMGLMRHLSHPKPPHKLRLVMPPPQIAKDAIDQIRLDVEFSESQSRPGGPEVAVMTSINALKLMLLEIETQRQANAQLSNSLRSLIATLETVDSDERERAREEGRSVHVHTSSIREANAALLDHGTV